MITVYVVICVTYITVLNLIDHSSNIFPTRTVKYSLIIRGAVLDIQLIAICVNAQMIHYLHSTFKILHGPFASIYLLFQLLGLSVVASNFNVVRAR